MTMTIDQHYEPAGALLIEGQAVVKRIGQLEEARGEIRRNEALAESAVELAESTFTEVMDELGRKAMGIWAQAQVHATLATVRL